MSDFNIFEWPIRKKLAEDPFCQDLQQTPTLGGLWRIWGFPHSGKPPSAENSFPGRDPGQNPRFPPRWPGKMSSKLQCCKQHCSLLLRSRAQDLVQGPKNRIGNWKMSQNGTFWPIFQLPMRFLGVLGPDLGWDLTSEALGLNNGINLALLALKGAKMPRTWSGSQVWGQKGIF